MCDESNSTSELKIKWPYTIDTPEQQKKLTIAALSAQLAEMSAQLDEYTCAKNRVLDSISGELNAIVTLCNQEKQIEIDICGLENLIQNITQSK